MSGDYILTHGSIEADYYLTTTTKELTVKLSAEEINKAMLQILKFRRTHRTHPDAPPMHGRQLRAV